MARTALLVVTFAWSWSLCAGAETTITNYHYNADGALTSITETRDGSSKSTHFLWDNFDAITGTPTAANGNLIGIGTMRGEDSIRSLGYDNLDRLVWVTNQHDGTAAVYEYHPDERLAASLNAEEPSTDGLQHYYDQSRYPQVTNLYDRHTGTLSSRHQRIRYLPDGSEQLLVRHRKDVDGVYDLRAQTMNGYDYDPYGARLGPALMVADSDPLYDLATNPYQYTHEHRDPVSGAYYLRARWYLPAHQTFLQRDPVANLNRYGYADGNPVSNHDPSGRNAAPFFSGLEKGFLASVSFGLAPAIAGAIKDPSAFFEKPENELLLAIGVVSTAVFLAEPLSGFFHARWIAVAGRAVTPAVRTANLFLVVSSTVQGLSGRALAAKSSDPNGLAFSAGSVVGGFLGGVTLSGIGTLSRRVISRDVAVRQVRSEVRQKLVDSGLPRPAISYRQARALLLLEREEYSAEIEKFLRDEARRASAERASIGVDRDSANVAPANDQHAAKLADIKLRRHNVLREIMGLRPKRVRLPVPDPVPSKSLTFPTVILDPKGRRINQDGRFVDAFGNFVDKRGRPVAQ